MRKVRIQFLLPTYVCSGSFVPIFSGRKRTPESIPVDFGSPAGWSGFQSGRELEGGCTKSPPGKAGIGRRRGAKRVGKVETIGAQVLRGGLL